MTIQLKGTTISKADLPFAEEVVNSSIARLAQGGFVCPPEKKTLRLKACWLLSICKKEKYGVKDINDNMQFFRAILQLTE